MSETTASDIITGALKFINSYAPGESLAADDANDALATLNDLLESLSTQQTAVYASNENVFTYTPGQYIYSIGNPSGGTFAGQVTSGSPTITGASVPVDMKVGGDLEGTSIPDGTTILAFDALAGTVTMSANATSTPPSPLQIGYTIPGDFKMQRPLRITNAFTRIYTQGSGLDYPISIVDQKRYVDIGFKAVQAPWPIVLWYNPTFPYGTLYFYQNPSDSAAVHLFTDTILLNMDDLSQPLIMPQGYSRFLKRKLARELAPEYGVIWSGQMEKLAKEAEDYVKSLNAQPVPVANYDPELTQNPRTDAGWILYGGFR